MTPCVESCRHTQSGSEVYCYSLDNRLQLSPFLPFSTTPLVPTEPDFHMKIEFPRSISRSPLLLRSLSPFAWSVLKNLRGIARDLQFSLSLFSPAFLSIPVDISIKWFPTNLISSSLPPTSKWNKTIYHWICIMVLFSPPLIFFLEENQNIDEFDKNLTFISWVIKTCNRMRTIQKSDRIWKESSCRYYDCAWWWSRLNE